jgi:uncharacterized protein (TIGR03435 family)
MKQIPLIVSLFVLTLPISAQTPAPPARDFDVASVKRSPPNQVGAIYHMPGGRFRATGLTLRNLISFAYDVSDDRVVDLPPWGSKDHFDVDAVGDGSVETSPSKMETPEKKAMVRGLLAERFGLEVRLENRVLSTYSLYVAPAGAKLTPNTEKPYLIHAGRRSYDFQRATMAALAKQLSTGVRRDIGRPVIDKTGLSGEFDFTLKWSAPAPSALASGDAPLPIGPSPDDPPQIFEALQQQLGLQLKPDHESLPFVVVTKVDIPTAN